MALSSRSGGIGLVFVPAAEDHQADAEHQRHVGDVEDPCAQRADANVEEIERAAAAADARLDVMVEIDVGGRRCGVAPGAAAAQLAVRVAASKHLRFQGLQAYYGSAQHVREAAERQAHIERAVAHVRATLDALQAAGLRAEIVSGAGTGTYEHEAASGVYNELQPGSYVFMDVDYARNQLAPEEVRFEQSLFVLASVMSTPTAERAVVDAGLKAFSFDSGPPAVHGAAGLEYRKASDEHGVLAIAPGTTPPGLDSRVWLVPGHCDPTVNLYDWLVVYRGPRVEAVWPVSARGALG